MKGLVSGGEDGGGQQRSRMKERATAGDVHDRSPKRLKTYLRGGERPRGNGSMSRGALAGVVDSVCTVCFRLTSKLSLVHSIATTLQTRELC